MQAPTLKPILCFVLLKMVGMDPIGNALQSRFIKVHHVSPFLFVTQISV